MSRPALARIVALVACLLCFCVVVLGAYRAPERCRARLSGLARLLRPSDAGRRRRPIRRTSVAPLGGRPLQLGKAWREMVHRYAAGTLGLLVVGLTAMGFAWRRQRVVPAGYAAVLLGIILVQAVLGMLTVTWQLKPSIVTLHLLFGLTTLSLLWWLVLTLWRQRTGVWTHPLRAPRCQSHRRPHVWRWWAWAYWPCRSSSAAGPAAITPRSPARTCPPARASWWPQADFRSGFVLWHSLGNVDYEGGLLANPARVAIHLTHRIGALLATIALLAAALATLRPHVQQPRAARSGAGAGGLGRCSC